MKAMRTLLNAIVVAVSLAVASTSAAAEPKQTYTVAACSVGGQFVGHDGWTASSSPAGASVAVDECASAGRMGFDLGPASSAVGRWAFDPPPGTVVDAFSAYGIAGSGDLAHELVIESDGRAARSVGFMNGGTPVDGPLVFFGGPARSVALEFSCPSACSGPGSLRVTRIDARLKDLAAPAVEFDAERRLFRFSDLGGGVEGVELEVDGEVRQFRPGGERCHRPFTATVPCAPAGELRLADLGLDPGARSVFATFIDAAGNRTYAGPYVVHIDSPPIVAPLRQPDGIVIIDGEIRRRISYAPAKVGGIVRDVDGFPLAGVDVGARTCVTGGVCRSLPATRTNGQGRFTVAVPRGPSREVRLAYGTSEQVVRLTVAAPIQLSTDRPVTRNGRTIRFRGRIPEAGDSRAHVTLQAWARGKWMPFRTVALKSGRFSARYRFKGTFQTTRYRFRAVVGDEPDLPFAAGRSKVISVLVRATR
jgi:hypothetical protein